MNIFLIVLIILFVSSLTISVKLIINKKNHESLVQLTINRSHRSISSITLAKGLLLLLFGFFVTLLISYGFNFLYELTHYVVPEWAHNINGVINILAQIGFTQLSLLTSIIVLTSYKNYSVFTIFLSLVNLVSGLYIIINLAFFILQN